MCAFLSRVAVLPYTATVANVWGELQAHAQLRGRVWPANDKWDSRSEVYEVGGQDGLLGMALHPGLLQGSGNDYIYLAYTYDADTGDQVDRRAKIARYTYDPAAKKLGDPVDLITGLPSSEDHNAGRLLVGPDQKLYYAIGDQGKEQPVRPRLQPDPSPGSAIGAASTSPPCAELKFDNYVIPQSVPQQRESDWSDPAFVEPLTTLYTVPNGHNFQDPACGEQSYLCWPSIAPSSMDFVSTTTGRFADWHNTLLVTSLKNGALYSVKLAQDGSSAQGDVTQFFKTTNRYRDLALRPEGDTVYIITDGSGLARTPSGAPTTTLDNPGSILEFRASQR